MTFTPRPYQIDAIDHALHFFHGNSTGNAFEILPTGSGKSVVIANIGKELSGKTLVLQPSKEILEQNYAKFISYGYRAGIYSASAGQKFIDKTTFATIGSIINKKHLFRNVEHVIIDECHLVNSSQGQYNDFLRAMPQAKVLGLTATPYRLSSCPDGAMLSFLNRTTPRIFKDLIYYIQNDTLFNAGHLAKLKYIDNNVVDRSQLTMNSSGTDFTEASVRAFYRKIDMPKITIDTARDLLSHRRNLLIFCTLISEGQRVAAGVPGAVMLTGDTPPAERSQILKQFKAGIIKCVVNVGVLTTGFDYPELETVLMSRSTMSLSLWYQIVGRAMRPHAGKEEAWIVDLGGNHQLFGDIETMNIRRSPDGHYAIWNNGRQLTDVPFSKN